MDCIICNWSVEISPGEYKCRANKHIINSVKDVCRKFSNDPFNYIPKTMAKEKTKSFASKTIFLGNLQKQGFQTYS